MNPDRSICAGGEDHRLRHDSARCPSGRRGFTLIELMVAMAIAAMLLLVAIPNLRGLKKPPLVRATEDFVNGCREARARAILTGRPMQLAIEGGGGTIRVEPAPTLAPANFDAGAGYSSGFESTSPTPSSDSKPLFSAHLPEDVAFRKLVVNLKNVFDARSQSGANAQTALVRFYPNGTSDALLAELLVDQSEVFQITLDVIVGQPNVVAVP